MSEKIGKCQNCKEWFFLHNCDKDKINNRTIVYICPSCKHGNYDCGFGSLLEGNYVFDNFQTSIINKKEVHD